MADQECYECKERTGIVCDTCSQAFCEGHGITDDGICNNCIDEEKDNEDVPFI